MNLVGKLLFAELTLFLPMLQLHAQPVITNQPASQTNLVGTTVSFSVAVDGAGPFTFQWQFNGTNLPNNLITTVAGNGTNGYSGDGGAATNTNLSYPISVAFDASGNLYIADASRIRKVNSNGIITTVAGNGTAGYSGDGGAATNASLFSAFGVAFDSSGNLFISDMRNSRIRKVDTNGIITTVAGNGSINYTGDGGAATNASLRYPSGVAFDAFGNLYITDNNSSRIRRVDTNGIITTVAGNGPSYPAAGSYSGDGGTATNASLLYPDGLAFDANDNLYIADWGNQRIREVHFAGCPTFTLTNVSVTNSGNYTVFITSPYGSVTSAVATLTVTIPRTPPQIIASGPSFGFVNNQFGFNLSGATSQMIVVDGSTNLVDWIPLITNTAGGTSYFNDPNWTNYPGRFYRLRSP